jgi:glutaconate CoA-transferase subunit A
MTIVDIETLAAGVPDGARLAIAKDDTGASIATTLAMIRRRVRGLRLLCVPQAGLQADLLIGAGCVESVETSAITLGEFGAAPRFTAAVRSARVRIIDATCPAVYAGLQAGQKGIPFMPLRGIVGSDLIERRSDWRIIDNPFADHDRIVAVAAIVPDVALFHAKAADRYGNVFLGRDRDGLLLAHASRRTLVTVERLLEGNLLEDDARSGAVLPSIYVTQIAVAPGATWPLGFRDDWGADRADDGRWLAHYAARAASAEGFDAVLGELTRVSQAITGGAAGVPAPELPEPSGSIGRPV